MKVIKDSAPIDLHWPTQDPFLFCAHHFDHFPAGNENQGIDAKHFSGRQMGSDFVQKDGFRLYHGKEIPGFPVHPHRGFETITIVRQGYVDHADSLGAAGRYGEGDVQWMTAGSGVQHSEMFPLLHEDKDNTLEIFQIWLNLPAKSKMVQADFKMMWADEIPKLDNKDMKFHLSLISGEYEGLKYYPAPTASWAANPDHQVNIYLVKLEAGGKFSMPAATKEKSRMLYHFVGDDLDINGQKVRGKKAYALDEKEELLVQSEEGGEVLILDATPIKEPVAQHGPFVMNTREEVIQTFQDYQTTQFGGWEWGRHDMIHGPGTERFAKYPDGSVIRPKKT